MKNLFNDISQEERKRILEMHENATKRNYLTEQGVTPQGTNTTESADKITALKTDEAKRTKFSYIGDVDMRTYFGPNVLKTDPNEPSSQESREKYNLFAGTLKNALSWYAMYGRNPQTNSLSSSVEAINKLSNGFTDSYAALTGQAPYTGQAPKLMKAPDLDKKFIEIYNRQLTRI
jgi:carboxylesterase type B